MIVPRVYLVQSQRNKHDSNHSMQVVLRWPSRSVGVFHEVDKRTQCTLSKIEDKEGDAPALVMMMMIINIIKVTNRRGKAPCDHHRDALLLLVIRTQCPE